jgi:pimeloyl-ACP methyl ester carboxylesterase
MGDDMDPTAVAGVEFDLTLPSGQLHGKRFGNRDAPLAVCLPGLSANMVSFDFLCERIAGDQLQTVALDLRGRGRSDVTSPGTYGWESHARDVVAVANELRSERFSILGQSMGGAVAMTAASQARGRLDRIVLLDICGTPDAASLTAIETSVNRLGQIFPSVDVYIAAVRGMGLIEPWSDYWERYFHYELEPVAGGVRARSDREAVLEDYSYGKNHDPYSLWAHLTMPVLLLRASREILPRMGRIVSDADRARFPRDVPSATVVDIDANHYTVNTSDDSVAAIRHFFSLT